MILTMNELLLQRLARLAQALVTARDRQAVFRALLDFCVASIPCHALHVYLDESNRQERTCVYAWSEGEELDVSRLPLMPMDDDPSKRAMATSEIIVTDDIDGDPRLPRSSIAVPLSVMGRMLGAFELQSLDRAAYRAEHVTALRFAGSLAALAIENVNLRQHNARLMDETVNQHDQYAVIALENARLFEQVRAGRAQLQVLTRRLMEAQEAERRHIARELHDEIGQALTAVQFNLQAMELLLKPSGSDSRLADSMALIERVLQQVRNLSLDLRPSLLDDFGLVAALRWYVNRQAERAGFSAEFTADLPETRIPQHIETACFRVAQEALTNVVRHAQAKRVTVELWQQGTELQLVIRDDGLGFDVHAAQERASRGASLGLLGMQERVRLAGGQIEIDSALTQGTEIRARFPLSSSPAHVERRATRRESP